MVGRRGTAVPGQRMPRRRRRDSYAWWEVTLMALVGLLILGGVVLLARMVLAGGSEPGPAPTAPVAQPTVGPACSAAEWEDPVTGQCQPREECTAGLLYDDTTNTCRAAAPNLTSVDPRTGAAEGGTELTLTGSGFQAGATVTVNGVPGVDTRVVSDGTVVTTTPPGAVYYGVDVEITNPDGQTDVLDNIFEYVRPPVQYITEIVPPVGSTQGGEAVIIKGRDFVDGIAVSFRGRPATDVQVLNAETIRATIPAGPAGEVNVNVRVPGAEPFTLENGFTYARQAPRRVLLVRPREGAQSGGTRVTITGTGFDKGATVLIGARKAAKVDVVGSTRITAIAPPGDLGTVRVSVRNPGLPAAILDDAYTYVAAPTVTGVEPAKIPEEGKVRIIITGTGFAEGAKVTVDGAAATRVRVVSPTEIRATAPPGELGRAVVVVTNPGEPPAELKRAVTYVVGPEPEPEPTPSATPKPTPTIAACRPLTLPPATTPAGSDLILTDADLFPVSIRSPRLTAANLTAAPGNGTIDWKASPPRIVWRAPVAGTARGTITFGYQAANCGGTGTGSVAVSSN